MCSINYHYWKTISYPQLNTHQLPSTLALTLYNPGWVSAPTVWPYIHHIIKVDSRDYPLILITLSKVTFFVMYTDDNMFAIVCEYQLYIIMCMSVVIYSGQEWLSSSYCSGVTLPHPFAVPCHSGNQPAHMSIDKRQSTKSLMSWEEITELCGPESLNLPKL